MLRFSHCLHNSLDNRPTRGGIVTSLIRRSPFTPTKVPGTRTHYSLSRAWGQAFKTDLVPFKSPILWRNKIWRYFNRSRMQIQDVAIQCLPQSWVALLKYCDKCTNMPTSKALSLPTQLPSHANTALLRPVWCRHTRLARMMFTSVQDEFPFVGASGLFHWPSFCLSPSAGDAQMLLRFGKCTHPPAFAEA
jgi:hypothetical protein